MEASSNQKVPMYIKVFVFLNFATIVMPVAAQYISAFLLLVSFTINRFILKRNPSFEPIYKADSNSFIKLQTALLLYFVALMILLMITNLQSAFDIPFGKSFNESWHLAAKSALLPLVLLSGLSYFRRSYLQLFDMSKSLALYFAFYFLYCIVQRYTGIDWVHGFSTILPDNRFAYGVYRISGMMGHPLSLAYNLVFAIVLFGHFAQDAFSKGQKNIGFWWGG